jgi:hypothetical protein
VLHHTSAWSPKKKSRLSYPTVFFYRPFTTHFASSGLKKKVKLEKCQTEDIKSEKELRSSSNPTYKIYQSSDDIEFRLAIKDIYAAILNVDSI